MARVFGAMESAVIGGMAVGALLMPVLIANDRPPLGTRRRRRRSERPRAARAARPAQDRPHRASRRPSLELLRRVSLLSLLPGADARVARACAHARRGCSRRGLHSRGRPRRLFYVIETGDGRGDEGGRHVARLGPGDYVGEIALLRDVPRTATVTATSATVLQALDREHFIPAVTGQGEFRDAADAAIATRLGDAVEAARRYGSWSSRACMTAPMSAATSGYAARRRSKSSLERTRKRACEDAVTVARCWR